MSAPRRRLTPARAAGAAVALVLAAAVLSLARPTAVLELLARTRLPWLAAAAAAFALGLVARGLRLALLLPSGRLGAGAACLVAAAAQAAAQVVPLRGGELVLPVLLRRHAGVDLAGGAGTLLAARALDLAALGAWAAGALVWVAGARPLPLLVALALLAPAIGLPLTLASAARLAQRWLAPRGPAARRWSDRVARVHDAVAELTRRRTRLAAAVALSLALWGTVWVYTGLLLAAMGYRWPAAHVVAGSAAASVANLLPVNLVANVGTLEAGWTAAFTALGAPVAEAAASGVAAHLWALALTVAFGGAAWGGLALRPDPRPADPAR